MYTINFGVTCRQLRKRHKLSQEQLAEAVGVATSSISRIERGSAPHPKHEERIIELLGIKEFHEALVYGKGYETNLKRERLENKFLRTAWGGDVDTVGKIIEDYQGLVRLDADMKKLLFMQQIWYRMLGDTQTQSSDKYKEILDIKGKIKKKEEIKIKSIRLNYLDQMIMNCLGIAYYEEGQSEKAYCLFKDLLEKIVKESDCNPMYYISIARVANNLSAVCLKMGKTSEAVKICNLAIYYGYKGTAIKELINILNTKAKILRALGRNEEADKQERYVKLSREIIKDADLFKCESEEALSNFSLISVL